MTGKRGAVGRDEHELASPAADAGLGEFRVVIRNNKDKAGFAFEALFGFLERFNAIVELRAGGKQMRAIGEGVAVILHAGKFDAAGRVFFNDGEHFFQFVNVLAVNHKIQGEADAVGFQPVEDAEFLRVSGGAGDFAGGFFAGTLEAELEMVEAGGDESGEFGFVERKAAGDEADVESSFAGGADEGDDVGAGERFAAGEIGLEDAEFDGFAEEAGPGFGGEFGVASASSMGLEQ